MSKFRAIYGQDYIQITRNDKEVLYWDIQEWIEDPDVVFSICNAISLASRNKLDPLLKRNKQAQIRFLRGE